MRQCLLAIALMLLGCGAPPPMEVTPMWQKTALDICPAHVAGDSSDELLVVDSATVMPVNQTLLAVGGITAFPAGTFRGHGTVAGATDSLHVWVSLKRGDTAMLQDLRMRRNLVVAVGQDLSNTTKGWDGGVEQVAVADINADGRMEVVARVGSAWDMRPRGIVLLDWATGNCIARFDCGPNPTTFTLNDINNDGRDEIVFGCWAPGNGNDANGMSDSFTYAVALSCNLKPIWLQRLGRHSSRVVVASGKRLQGNSPFFVACELGSSVGNRTCDSIWLLDAEDGHKMAGTSSGRFNTAFTTVEDARMGTLAAVAGPDDALRAYDCDLRLVAKRHVAGLSDGVPIIAGRFTGQRSQDIAVSSGVSEVVILDSRIRERTAIPWGEAGVLRRVRFGARDRILAGTLTGSKPTWRLYDVRAVPVGRRPIPIGVVTAVTAMLMLAFMAALLGLRYRQTRDMRMVIRGLTGQAGVVEIDYRGLVRHTNPKARELLGGDTLPDGPLAQVLNSVLAEPPGSQPKELPVVMGSGKIVLARAARVRSGVMLTLEDISAVEYLQRVKAWAPVAQKLAHGIKNPLGTIMGAVEQIEAEVAKGRAKSECRSENDKKADERVKKYVGYVKDEVMRLKKMTDAFMRFTKLDPPALRLNDLNDLVRKVVAKYEGALAQGILLEMSLDDKLPPLSLDEEGIANVLDIVIENAIESMTGEVGSRQNLGDRVLRIRTTTGPVGSRQDTADKVLRESGDRHSEREDARYGPRFRDGGSCIRIEVEDTGMGIPQKYLDKVFEPYFTYGKADGTGLGLALASKIVEDHKGRIEIRSEEGVGTTVSIFLPIEGRTDA